MLNPIDSFFQYYVKRTFNVLYFFSKKNALHNGNRQMLLFIMFFLPSQSVKSLFTPVYRIFYRIAHWCFLKCLYLF